jgi:hypothetical protein
LLESIIMNLFANKKRNLELLSQEVYYTDLAIVC